MLENRFGHYSETWCDVPANANRDVLVKRFYSRDHSWSVLAWLLVTVFGFVALADSLGTPTLHDFDSRLTISIDALRGSRLDRLMLSLTAFGGWGMTVIALTAILGLWLAHHHLEAVLVLLATAGAMLLNLLLKYAIDRPRPDVSLMYLISGTRFASFPSGHTMGAMATLGSLMLVARRLGAPVWALWLGWLFSGLLIAGIATSRIYLGAHFPSDVFGGLLASIAWLLVVAGSLERHSRTEV
jgi:undecaprenyl-diphosphatase